VLSFGLKRQYQDRGHVMPNINGLTNPFENTILNSNLTQLEKEQQLANYSDAISQGYELPADVLDEMAAILASGDLSTEAQARLQELTDQIMAEIGPIITSDSCGDNIDDIVVQVNDGALLLDTQVTVADLNEGPPPPTNFGAVLNGIDANDRSGYSVSSAGDVNGDGFDDMLIGASGADPNGCYSGETYLVYGTASGIPSSFDLSILDGSNGFVMNGIDAVDLSGRSVSSAGDVNGDGYDDMLIGASMADPNGSNSGETYLIYGGNTILDAFDLADGVQDGSIELSHVTDEFFV